MFLGGGVLNRGFRGGEKGKEECGKEPFDEGNEN